MKTMLKRMISLMLVFAMLLSFVVVVAADNVDGTTYFATASADHVAVKVDTEKAVTLKVPVQLRNHTNRFVSSAQLEFSVDAEVPLTITSVLTKNGKIYGDAYGGQAGVVNGKGSISWAPALSEGQAVTDYLQDTFVWVRVEVAANAAPGTYALHVNYLPGENGDAGVFSLTDGASQDDRNDSYDSSVVEYIDGSITVLPAGA